MSHHQAPAFAEGPEAEAARALLRLRDVLALVERMAGVDAPSARRDPIDERALDEGAALALAYAHAPSVARRRFDALAGEAAGFAAAGLRALIEHKQRSGRECAPAARQLARDMRSSIEAMTRMIGEPASRA